MSHKWEANDLSLQYIYVWENKKLYKFILTVSLNIPPTLQIKLKMNTASTAEDDCLEEQRECIGDDFRTTLTRVVEVSLVSVSS